MTEQENREEKRKRATDYVNSTISELTQMQRAAVINRLCGMTKTESCREAGYKYPESNQSRIFDNEKVKAAVEEFFFNEEMEAREVVRRLSQQARAAYAEYLSEREVPVLDRDGELVGHRYVVGVDVNQMLADGKGHLIKAVKETANGQSIEFYDAQSALVHVGRYHGLFTDNTDITSGGERLEPVIYLPDNGRGAND